MAVERRAMVTGGVADLWKGGLEHRLDWRDEIFM